MEPGYSTKVKARRPDPLAQRVVQLATSKRGRRIYLQGLTNFGDWKLLAVFDSQKEMDAWMVKARAVAS